MIKITVYDQKGEKVGTNTLNPAVFDVSQKPALVQQLVVCELSNSREAKAKVKTRGEVRGGGRKPWRQKGTGKARAGSTRSPIWRSGGITFGPTGKENYTKKMLPKMRKLAINSILSQKIKENRIILLDKIEFKNISTKQVEEMFSKLPIKEGTILMLYSKLEPRVELSARNLPYVKTLSLSAINGFDLLKYDYIVLTLDTLKNWSKGI
ncbi:MAG: 50S ribosomal protein L4 [Candidatus Berkelbacteria bacterium]|nr:50S ribosomal protein L4 [Candidatus Berkelbacteria bacterium]